MTLAELIEKYIEYIRSQRGYSDHTIRNYRIDLTSFSDFLYDRKDLKGEERSLMKVDEIDYIDVREYLGSLYGRYNRTTIARKLSAIRSFFYFLEKNGLVEGNPAADISTPKRGKYIPGHLPVDDMFKLLQCPDKGKTGFFDFGIDRVICTDQYLVL